MQMTHWTVDTQSSLEVREPWNTWEPEPVQRVTTRETPDPPGGLELGMVD